MSERKEGNFQSRCINTCLPKIQEWIQRIPCYRKEKKKSSIRVEFPIPKRKNHPNYLRTAKYTWYSFLPLNLFQQLKKLSNMYFLIILVVSLIPGISPLFPAATFLPPMFLIISSLIKDFLDDLTRWKSDRKANRRKVMVTSSANHRRFVHRKKSQINPGDYLEIRKGEEIPCDMISIFSSKENGIFYIESANLDGETNLKRKQSVFEEPLPQNPIYKNPETRNRLRKKKDCVEMIVSTNTKKLDQFDGFMKIHRNIEEKELSNTSDENTEQDEIGIDEYALSLRNFVCGGCVLRNTARIQGFALYCGKDSKMFKNLKQRRFKWGSLDRRINLILFIIIVIQQLLIIFMVVFSFITEIHPSSEKTMKFYNSILPDIFFTRRHFYLEPLISSERESVGLFWTIIGRYMTFFVLFGYLIPMSVFVTLEIVLTFQSKQIESNIPKSKCKSSNLNFDLPRVDILISDKTGTLTKNRMKFHSARDQDGEDITKLPMDLETISPKHFHFLMCLATNNSVSPSYSYQEKEDEEEQKKVSYDGESSDEVAIMRDYLVGRPVRLVERKKDRLVLSLFGEEVEVLVIHEFFFTSSRKRMSCVIQPCQDFHGLLDSRMWYIYTKGAECEIFKRCRCQHSNKNCQVAVEEYSKLGLRVLVTGYKVVEEGDSSIREFQDLYNKKILGEAEEEVDDVLERLQDESIEREFDVLGVTAIEDELQEGVFETTRFFLDSGMKIFVFTGDSCNTAVQTSVSAGIIDTGGELFRLDFEKKDEDEEKYMYCKKSLEKIQENVEKAKKKKKLPRFALLINSDFLEILLEDSKLIKILFRILKYCYSLVCSRCTPFQKGILTKLIKKKTGRKTMAVGDGINDISMIKQADIGVGIVGNEGTQASRAADYSILRFKDLFDLMVVEGRWCYYRSSYCILSSLFKNLPVTLILVLFCFFNGFSATLLLDSWILTFFNMFFTSLPPFLLGVRDKDIISSEYLRNNPRLFKEIREKNPYFSCWKVIKMYLYTVVYSSCFFVLVYLMVAGKDSMDITTMGFLVSTSMFFNVCVHIGLQMRLWDCLVIFSWTASVMFYVEFSLIYSTVFRVLGRGEFFFIVFEGFLGRVESYLWLVLIVGFCCVPIIVLKYFCFCACPTEIEKEIKRERKRRKIFTCCLC